MANIDSFGSTLLDGRRESRLKDFAGSIKGEQIHIGRSQSNIKNHPTSVPMVSGSNLVFSATTQDVNFIPWVRVAISSISSGQAVTLNSGVPSPPSYTATSSSTVAAASGLAAACAGHAHQNYRNFSWSSEGANVYGIAINPTIFVAFTLGGSFEAAALYKHPAAPSSTLSRITVSKDLASISSVIGPPWLYGGTISGSNHALNASSLELLDSPAGLHVSLTATSIDIRHVSDSIIDLFDLTTSWLYINSLNLIRQINKNGTAEAELFYDGFDNGIYSACTDGTHYYLIGGVASDFNAIAILKINSSYDVVSCYSYADEAGSQIFLSGPMAQFSNDTIVLHCTRSGHNPAWVGIKASDLATVKWCKTSRKQELSTTVGINDVATSYRITIASQTVSVTGNAGGAGATATDLKNACVASILSEFVKLTWSVNADVVLGTRNVAGALSTNTSASVTGGTGTISHLNTPYTSKFLPAQSRVDGDRVYFGGRRVYEIGSGSTFAGRKVEAHTGAYDWTITTDENPTGSNFNYVAAIDGSDIYFVGTLADPAQRFSPGADPFDTDISITHLPLHQNNLTDQEASITLTVTNRTGEITRIDTDPEDLFGDVIDPPGRVEAFNAFSIDDVDYTY